MPINDAASEITSEMRLRLVEAANLVAESARQEASWSTKIPGAITVGEVVEKGGKIWIRVGVKNEPKGVAGQARAFEKGSGIHSKSGATYPIYPKDKAILAFFWDKVDKNSPRGPKFKGISKSTGKALLTHVDHPGVEAKPFLKPAVDKNRAQIKKILGMGFKQSLSRLIRKQWYGR